MRKTNSKLVRPPSNALRVSAWRDLPKDRRKAHYRITTKEGDCYSISVSKGTRCILDALIAQPIYCASPVRISDRVCILRREYGVPITKKMYVNDSATGRAKFGVYFLDAHVVRLDSDEDVA